MKKSCQRLIVETISFENKKKGDWEELLILEHVNYRSYPKPNWIESIHTIEWQLFSQFSNESFVQVKVRDSYGKIFDHGR